MMLDVKAGCPICEHQFVYVEVEDPTARRLSGKKKNRAGELLPLNKLHVFCLDHHCESKGKQPRAIVALETALVAQNLPWYGEHQKDEVGRSFEHKA